MQTTDSELDIELEPDLMHVQSIRPPYGPHLAWICQRQNDPTSLPNRAGFIRIKTFACCSPIARIVVRFEKDRVSQVAVVSHIMSLLICANVDKLCLGEPQGNRHVKVTNGQKLQNLC